MGLRLRLRFMDGGGLVVRDLIAGTADFGIFGLPAAMMSNLRDNALVALAAQDGLPLYSLVVREDLRRRIRTIADLRGRSIGVFTGSPGVKTTSQQLAELVLANNGVSPSSVNFLPAGQSFDTQAASLSSRAIDAIFSDEPQATELSMRKLGFILFSTGRPSDIATTPGAGFLRATLISTRDRVNRDPMLAEKMVRILQSVLGRISSQSPEVTADTLRLTEPLRSAFILTARSYPQQYSADARFSKQQLGQTEIFFRKSNPENPKAQGYSVDRMVIDRWAGSKP